MVHSDVIYAIFVAIIVISTNPCITESCNHCAAHLPTRTEHVFLSKLENFCQRLILNKFIVVSSSHLRFLNVLLKIALSVELMKFSVMTDANSMKIACRFSIQNTFYVSMMKSSLHRRSFMNFFFSKT